MTETSDAAAPQLESGAYEILRNRLTAAGDELRGRLLQLNEARKQVFGSVDLKLLGTERITTEHNCTPRDMAAVGEHLIFGFNVHFGLRTERSVGDVFAIYQRSGEEGLLQPVGLDLLSDARFAKDFQDIYRYYKHAVFSKFLLRGPHLYMVFQVGKNASDIKSFKWAIHGDRLEYLDNRSDHEVRFPPQHEFEWRRTTRDAQRHGTHPHISIEDKVFVETVGGDLTIKVENNTDSGAGIYSEPVDNADQTLDDAEIHYAVVGNIILLKIRPYQEQTFRYIIFNQKIQRALRVDAVEHSCVLLPDDQGLIFSQGYYLQNGEFKTFDTNMRGLVFERRVHSPNGEDTLFAFYQPEQGAYVLLDYNVIEQQVATPVSCNGFTLFRNGEMLLFKTHAEPQKHHPVQKWRTPYINEDFQPPARTDSYLYKIGNRDIVRGMAECQELLQLIQKEDSYAGLYLDLNKLAGDVLDSYFWIDQPEAAALGEPLRKIRAVAAAAVDEYEKVVRLRRAAAEALAAATQSVRDQLQALLRRSWRTIDDFVQSLATLRGLRGDLIALREQRDIDLDALGKQEQLLVTATDDLSQRTVEFLLQPEALQPYVTAVENELQGIDACGAAADVRALDERIRGTASALELLIEIVSNLKITDAVQRTAIIDAISAIFSQVNAARAAAQRRLQELASSEGAAEFASQLKLLSQSVVNALDVSSTPEHCDENLSRLLVQLEELEGKFAEFDEFTLELAEKREEITSAFETRRIQLLEKRQKRCQAIAQAADRLLKGITHRVAGFGSLSEIHGYFASDLMVDKVRNQIEELSKLGDGVRADELQSRLKTIREDAVRQLKDRQDLFEDGSKIIRFGKHRFSVNTQPLDLTTLQRDGRLNLHFSGTAFFEPIDHPELEALADVAEMESPSENGLVYRAEYLAYLMLRSKEVQQHRELRHDAAARLVAVQQFMAPRYHDNYLKGVHDHDAALLLGALLRMQDSAGLLSHAARIRALASLYWWSFADAARKKLLEARFLGAERARRTFDAAPRVLPEEIALRDAAFQFLTLNFDSSEIEPADATATHIARYLAEELGSPERLIRGGGFVVSAPAAELWIQFQRSLQTLGAEQAFQESLRPLQKNVIAGWRFARDWLRSYMETRADATPEQFSVIDEAATLAVHGPAKPQDIVTAQLNETLTGWLGSHPLIRHGEYQLSYSSFLERLSQHVAQTVPRYERRHALKVEIVEAARQRYRLEEFQPKVLSSFVRNRLIDEVYLPLLGDNLAKQLGTAGANTRTDRQGLLLLVSPPGYGKTTLMEYIAQRLGIVFVKVNGPAIGHATTSLDPAAAANASAREEIEKLNLAFEMGDNVMIYLDDIQHCHPELLQKFISLCDAQRKVEGVWRGRTRTYDFRGRKVAVVMAGNPYTESGEAFRIPDMLANRADVYNLGDLTHAARGVFELSYLENALTSNAVLARLASRSRKDVLLVIQLAEQLREARDATSPVNSVGLEFEGSYTAEELNEFAQTMARLMRVRDVLLKVNQAYIASAAQQDDYRTEPPFLLQGSYRNMNRIAEKVLPIMNQEELDALIADSYQNDAQTLAQGAEANLLKFRELVGWLVPEEKQRWEDIKRVFRQNARLKGVGSDDKLGQVIGTLQTFADGLDGIRRAVATAAETTSAALSAPAHAVVENQGDPAWRPLATDLQELGRQLAAGVQLLEAFLAKGSFSPLGDGTDALTNAAVPRVSVPATDGDAASPNDRITIVNRLPRAVYEIIETQFTLMSQWLEPLTRLAESQQQELKALRPAVERCLKTYEQLLNRLEVARRDA